MTGEHRSEMVSVRMERGLVGRLETAASRTGQSRSGLIQRYVDEGLRCDRHPRITFKDGPAGRRAAMVNGPDVWELISVIDTLDSSGDEAVDAAAGWLGLAVGDVRAGVAYAAEFATEVRERIELNRQLADEAYEAWQSQQELLAKK